MAPTKRVHSTTSRKDNVRKKLVSRGARKSSQPKKNSSVLGKENSKATVVRLRRKTGVKKDVIADEEEEGNQYTDVEDDEYLPPKLKRRTLSVPQSTIDKNWKTLSDISKKHLISLLEQAIAAVLSQITDEKGKVATQQELNKIVERIDAKLSRIKVPLQKSNKNFVYQKLHAKNRTTEMALAPDLEQITRMEVELQRVQKEIEKAQEDLQTKTVILKSRETALQKSNFHPLLKMESEPNSEIDDNFIKAHIHIEHPDIPFKPETDKLLRTLNKSVASNLQRIDRDTESLDVLMRYFNVVEHKLMGLMENIGIGEKVLDKILV